VSFENFSIFLIHTKVTEREVSPTLPHVRH